MKTPGRKRIAIALIPLRITAGREITSLLSPK
jgi:hypothetical protein